MGTPPLIARLEKWDAYVTEICSALHGSVTGSGHGYSDAEELAIVAALRERLATWTPSHALRHAYDGAHRDLIEATLIEWERSRGKPDSNKATR